MSRNKARVVILSSLMAFPTINQKDWSGSMFGEDAIVGDLVSLCAAPASKWYLSWVREIDAGGERYLLESIDDGELCWGSNVGLNVYNRERVRTSPTWRWDDNQFAFWGRWNKACTRNNAYIVLPTLPVFVEDEAVALDVRIRFGFNDYSNSTVFPNWKKLTIKKMEAFYLECVADYQSKKVDA